MLLQVSPWESILPGPRCSEESIFLKNQSCKRSGIFQPWGSDFVNPSSFCMDKDVLSVVGIHFPRTTCKPYPRSPTPKGVVRATNTCGTLSFATLHSRDYCRIREHI